MEDWKIGLLAKTFNLYLPGTPINIIPPPRLKEFAKVDSKIKGGKTFIVEQFTVVRPVGDEIPEFTFDSNNEELVYSDQECKCDEICCESSSESDAEDFIIDMKDAAVKGCYKEDIAFDEQDTKLGESDQEDDTKLGESDQEDDTKLGESDQEDDFIVEPEPDFIFTEQKPEFIFDIEGGSRDNSEHEILFTYPGDEVQVDHKDIVKQVKFNMSNNEFF